MKKTLILIVLFAAAGVCFFFPGKQTAPENAAVPPLPVHAVKAESAYLPFVYGTVGTVAALQQVGVRPQIAGKLTEILFKEGALVKKGDLIARIDDSEPKAELARAKADLAANQAKLIEAEKNLSRFAKLKQNGFVSQKNWDSQKTLCAQLRAAVDSGKAQVEIARIAFGYTRVTAQISGRIGLKNVDEGNIVSVNQSIAEIVQTNPVSIVFSVPQSLFSALESHQNAVVKVSDGLSGAELGKGKIIAVDNAFNVQSGTVRVRATLDNTAEKLWIGQAVAVDLIYGENTENIVLPNKAVRPGLNGSFVFKAENGKIAVAPVQTGYADNENTVILSGLQAGDFVVTNNFSRLKNGTAVEISAERNEQ